MEIVRREQPAVLMEVVHRRLIGLARRPHRATEGNRSAFLRLQTEQAATTFSQLVIPPFERGTTWSKVRSSRSPQYWQVKRSRRKTLNRVKAGNREGLM